jgi:predicted DNA-binding transcriptional regulator YafY
VGFNEYKNGLRMYKIDKIGSLEVLDEYFEPDEEFSLSQYCAKSFGIYQEEPIDIVLEFNAEIKDDVLNYHFHPTQKIKELENGNVQVKFTSGGTHAICQELFKWGSNVKIQKPTALKTLYKGYLEDVLNNLRT